MSSRNIALFVALLSSAVAGSCVDSGSVDNDNTASRNAASSDAGKKDAGAKDAKIDAKIDAKTDPQTDPEDEGDDDEPTDEPSDKPSDTDAGSGGGKDAGAPAKDGGSPKTDSGSGPMMSVIKGTAEANDCSSFGEPKSGKCGSWFCGVTEEQIAAEFPANACGTLAQTCEGKLPVVVGDCAVGAKTDLANLSKSDEELRPIIAACIREESEFAESSDECLACFIDVAECAGQACLLDCLGEGGKGPACDECRVKNNCDQKVFDCAHLPNPF